jgi:hypothetical protein
MPVWFRFSRPRFVLFCLFAMSFLAAAQPMLNLHLRSRPRELPTLKNSSTNASSKTPASSGPKVYADEKSRTDVMQFFSGTGKGASKLDEALAKTKSLV